MSVQYHNRRKLDDDLAGGAKYVDFGELLETSDIISLNLPLNVSQYSPSLLVMRMFLRDPATAMNTNPFPFF